MTADSHTELRSLQRWLGLMALPMVAAPVLVLTSWLVFVYLSFDLIGDLMTGPVLLGSLALLPIFLPMIAAVLGLLGHWNPLLLRASVRIQSLFWLVVFMQSAGLLLLVTAGIVMTWLAVA